MANLLLRQSWFGRVLSSLIMAVKVLLLVVLMQAYTNIAFANTVLGPGASVTCGSWVQSRSGRGQFPEDTEFGLTSWALGYLSGRGVSEDRDPIGRIDSSGIRVWLDRYCQNHPLVPFTDALSVLFHTLNRY
jgi:hypothetical protein